MEYSQARTLVRILEWVAISFSKGIFLTHRSSTALNLPAKAEDIRNAGSVRSPGGGNGSPLQTSCLENAMERGAWKAMVHSVAKSQTQLK